jgi:hypothetical protein
MSEEGSAFDNVIDYFMSNHGTSNEGEGGDGDASSGVGMSPMAIFIILGILFAIVIYMLWGRGKTPEKETGQNEEKE